MVPDHPFALNLSGLSKEDAYNKIESEIIRLKDQIRSLLSVRNSLSPVSSLPNELLAKVFMHSCDFNESGTFSNLRPDEGDQSNDAEDGAQPEMRLVVSRVSHRWRGVALAHRPLWNLVVNLRESVNLDYVRFCGARCQNLLVDLSGPSHSLLDTCVSTIAQITQFKIAISFDAVVPSALSGGHIWSQPAPLLETLDLSSICIGSNDAQGVHYPKLQSLILYDCDFRWKFVTSLASTLSKLDICSPRRTITIPTCLNLLSSLSFLSECALHHCLKDNEDSAPATPRPNRFCMQQLTKLTLNDSTPLIIQFLRAIGIPRASLQLFFQQTESFERDAVELVRVLQESHDYVWGSVRYLQIHDSLVVSSSAGPPCHDIITVGCHSHLLLLHIYQWLDLSSLKSLWTTHLTVDVLKVLSHLTRLHRVVLASPNALEKFVTFMRTEAHDDASTLLFPALQELVLAHFESSASEWLGGLRDILASRRIWGFGLQKLVLFKCSAVGIEEVARLRQVVDDLEFGRQRLECFFMILQVQ
ncbi:hypothetical protein BDN72DRAFT_904100 [Pluteus cervinus]|uniref:Uncharacterized protein n=1 Tax=Pluteus cervinus TaxID=181527 RepID=A0ACD3A789_9AGAR|nr:hypothetical protein BDN72DRAFT_904100 [Pluteus cervinus]